MSSSIDDNIELIALNSPSSTKSYIKTKLKLNDNKVGSPPTSSPAHSNTKNETQNQFLAKTQAPQPKPRLLPPVKKHKRKSSRTTTEITSESQETSDGYREKPSGDELTESVFSSRSDTRSHREKFRERFESVKKQAGNSVSKAHTFKSKAEKIRGLKRSINLMKKENEEIETELRNYEKNKKSTVDVGDGISKIEAYNFFCVENEADLNKPQEGQKSQEQEDLNNFGKSTEVLIEVPEKDEDDCDICFLPADNLDFNIKLSENDQFWQPSRKRLEVSEKLETDEPRILADEGFFIEEKPKVSSSHLNFLEQRLLSVNDKKWFNCEGELEILPNPYTKTSYRPHLYLQTNPQLETEYVAPTTDPPATENILVTHNNILNISIFALKFKHHPLFSPEHVFEQKLITLYAIYKQKLNVNKLERISKRLDALRNAKKNIEATVIESKGNLNKFHSYTDEIKKLRELHFEEGRQSRVVLKSILQTWRIVKKVRQTNNYSSTNIKLNIRKEKCSYEQEKHIWNAKVEETCAEVISEVEFDFHKKMSVYKKELEQWKREVENEEQIEEKIPKKPRKPVKNIDHDITVQEVSEKFKDSFKPPGEPILHFTLSYDNDVDDKIENSKEKLRRNAVTTTKVYLRVLCNKIEVCKSKTVLLNDKFTCFIAESFSIQLSAIPENLVVEIHEQPSTLMKRKLGEVKITVPSRNVTMGQSKIFDQHFQKEEIVHYKHVGVGSGIELKNIFPESNEDSEDILYTSGVITCKVGWDINHFTNAKDFEANIESDVVKSVLNEDGTIDVHKLIKWANENNPDPQDPKNSVLYEYIKNYDEDIGVIPSTTKAYFRCNSDMGPLQFCESRDIEENLRFQILELRNKNEPEFVGMVVPNRLKEIPLDILADYKQRQDEESRNLLEDDFEYDEDEIESKRSHGRKHLKQVYTKVFQQCRNTENNLVYEDVVNEKIISHIESLTRNIISNIISWFQFQPTINILTPKAIKKTSTKMTDLNAQVRIIINVKSAVNVPQRNVVRTSSTSRSNTDANAEDVTVKPFVVAAYQNVNLQTSSAEGADPVWNEELILPLESANADYLSPNSMSGSVMIRLFDEITIKTRHGDAKAKNWLGSIEIPVSAIAYNNKMEGLFKLQKPPNLFGYEQEVDENYATTKTNTRQTGVQSTYLSLKITLQPHVPKLTQSMDELETTELPYIKQHIINWNEAYNNEYPNRKFSALAIDINGKTTCITRYIRPLEPPQLNTDRFDVSADQCARYVSMIPFTDSNKFYQNVWLTTEQLLKLMIGSVIDHAIALTCYLTSLDLETWLLLGYGLPHGTTSYVLVREYVREQQIPLHFIYDIVTATKYDIMDTLCPLQKIFCVINEHNLWANVQRTNQIQLTRYDFMRRSDWLPLFTNQITAPTNSVQQKLIYSITPDIKQLEMRIDKKIRKKLAKLRKHERTIWNHQLSRVFKNAVGRCETSSMHGRRNSELFPDILSVSKQNSLYIRNFALTHSINGYIVNMPYTTISAIINAVISTGLYLHEGVDTEFGLAIQIYSYPNHVLAVWICLAAITRRSF